MLPSLLWPTIVTVWHAWCQSRERTCMSAGDRQTMALPADGYSQGHKHTQSCQPAAALPAVDNCLKACCLACCKAGRVLAVQHVPLR